MKIIAKASPELIRVKTEYGFGNIEIQLLKKVVTAHEIECIRQSMEDGADVLFVHTPLLDGVPGGEVNITDIMMGREGLSMLQESAHLAQMAASFEKHGVGVIIHNDVNQKTYKTFPAVTDEIADTFERVLEEAPDVSLYIENTCVGELRYQVCSGCSITDADFLVRSLRRITGHPDRYFSLFDTCHFMSTSRLFQGYTGEEPFTFDETFASCRDTLGLIHLANITGNGMTQGGHGTPFTGSREDTELLGRILDAYVRYAPEVPVTIEVREKDYRSAPCNLIETFRNVEAYFGEPAAAARM